MKLTSLDSSVWIEMTHNGTNAATFLDAIVDFSQVIVSTISVYEVWNYTLLHADQARAEKIHQVMQQGICIAPTADICITAARLSLRHKIAMADSLIYATALAHHATLWTQDDDFKDLPHVRYVPKV